MKSLKYLFVSVALLLGITSSLMAQIKLPVNEFEQKIKTTPQAQVVDVRTPGEYASGHLDHASNMNYNSAEFKNQIQKLDKTKPVFIYCLSGGRSAKAAAEMMQLGFTVYDMQGGMMAWNNNSKTVVTTTGSTYAPGMSVSDYQAHIKSDKLVVVDFNAPWCAPCQKMSPMLDEISREQKDKLSLFKINIEENKELAKALNVDVLPVVVIYKNGKEVWKHEGEIEKSDLMKAIQKL